MRLNKILLVEDSLDIRNIIEVQLRLHGLIVESYESGEGAKQALESGNFDIYIFDRMLPGVSGLELCKMVRGGTNKPDAPILLVTAMTTTEQIVEGLDAGADDYVTKPFDMNILLARVRALQRRLENNFNKKEALSLGPFKIDLTNHSFSVDNTEVGLTKSEFTLMTTLLRNIGKVMSRASLVSIIQGDEIHVTSRTIDTHIFGLRKKLGMYGKLIESIRGIGYRINEND